TIVMRCASKRGKRPRRVMGHRQLASPNPGHAIALFLLLAIALSVRLAEMLAIGNGPDLRGDEAYYVSNAVALAAGRGLLDTFRPPGFSLLLAGVVRVAGDSLTVLRLAQVLVAVAGVAVAYDIVRRRFGARAGLVSGIVLALHPTLVQYAHFLWSESLFATQLL